MLPENHVKRALICPDAYVLTLSNIVPYNRRSVYHPSTSSVHEPKAINASTRGFKTTFDHDDPRRRTGIRDYGGPISNDAAESNTERELDADKPDLYSDSDDSAFHWEEEATLIFDLMEAGPEQRGDEYLEALVETLQTPFTEQGKLLKKKIAQTLVPTNNHVKAIIQVLEKSVDATYGQGLSLLNNACKNIEGTMYAQQADFEDVYQTTRCNIEKAYKELEKEYSERDTLWNSLNQAIEGIVTPTLLGLREAPAKVENTISQLDKHAKFLGNDS
ncbi:hypothetical protein CVT25_015269 [Psilocybe cyanescens]|uniref:Uncharacterized protein n=1 Tax=Psilocybe cyanescens TaxID=93625 RepID=A0A409XRE5_PSICY|nr:hypothetical protein CVT25_015269 [Psilocybe cyanescens]